MSLTLTQVGSTDTFTAADGTTLATYNAAYTAIKGTPGFETIVSNTLGLAFSNSVIAWQDPTTQTNDNFAEVTLSGLGGSFGVAYLCVRLSGTGGTLTGYYLGIETAGGSVHTGKIVAGSFVDLDTRASTYANTDVAAIAIVGTTIYVLKNGSQLFTITDSTTAAGSGAGFGFTGAGSSVRIDNWIHGNAAVSSAPVLSGQTNDAPASTSVNIKWTTSSLSDGTNYVLHRIGGSPASAATIIAGGVSSSAGGSNPQQQLMTGYTAASTNHYFDIVQVGGSGNSNVVSVGPLTMAAAGPTINTQPSNATVTAPNTANFTVSATTSGGALSYQWQKQALGLGGWNNTSTGSGSTTASYTTGPTSVSGGTDNSTDHYRCNVTDSNGTTATSGAATLTVNLGALTVTTDPLEDETGAVLSARTIDKVFAIRVSDGSLVHTWLAPSTNLTGQLVLTDASLTNVPHVIATLTTSGLMPAGAKVYTPA